MEYKVHEVVINKEMKQSCMFYHQRFCTHMKKQKEKGKASAADEKIQEIRLEVDECKNKEHRLEADANGLIDKADKLCLETEVKNRMLW